MTNPSIELELLNKKYSNTLNQYNKVIDAYKKQLKVQVENYPNITSESECSKAGGTNWNKCSATGTTYCCGVCKGTKSCSSNSGLSSCSCANPDKKQLDNLYSEATTLNQKLQSLGSNISQLQNQLQRDLSSTMAETIQTEASLKDQNKKLKNQKKKILLSMKEIDEADGDNSQASLRVNSNYSFFIVLLIIAVLCIVVLGVIGAPAKSSSTSTGTTSTGSTANQIGGKKMYNFFKKFF